MEAGGVQPGPALALDQIQGNIAGFNKPHQRFVFLGFPDKAAAQAFLRVVEREVDTADDVAEANRSFKWRRRHRRDPEPKRWFNLLLSISGLRLLEAPELDLFEPAFQEGMRARAEHLGDRDQSAPESWLPVFQQDIHALAILAADLPEDLDRLHRQLSRHAHAHRVFELGQVEGHARTGDNHSHEHFGFRDGMSQPGVIGLTDEPKPGQEMIPAGEFILGYSGQPEEALPPPPPNAYQPVPAPPPQRFPGWAVNGSFFVFRRLRQDVAGFNDFIARKSGEIGMRPDLLEAKLVGRYRSGAPLELTRDQAPDFDPQAADPAIGDRSILEDEKINNFEYEPHDADGHLVPRAAHIRKMYPRNADPPGKAESERHRILRRGIPYGLDFEPAEPPYPGQGAPPDNQDRGLLFGCYQASIERGFEFLQTQWANQPDFPQQGDGRDPITSQDAAEPTFSLPPDHAFPDHHIVMARWVFTTGGEYFFSPSIDAIKQLAAGGEPMPGSPHRPDLTVVAAGKHHVTLVDDLITGEHRELSPGQAESLSSGGGGGDIWRPDELALKALVITTTVSEHEALPTDHELRAALQEGKTVKVLLPGRRRLALSELPELTDAARSGRGRLVLEFPDHG